MEMTNIFQPKAQYAFSCFDDADDDDRPCIEQGAVIGLRQAAHLPVHDFGKRRLGIGDVLEQTENRPAKTADDDARQNEGDGALA